MNIDYAISRIKVYNELTSGLVNIADNESFEKEIISKTADFLKNNLDINNIYICQRNGSFIILKNTKCNPFFKINIDTFKKENLPFTIKAIGHPLEEKHPCPLLDNEGIPTICLPINKSIISKDYNSYLHIQLKDYKPLNEDVTILLSHISLTLQNSYEYHNKLIQLGKNHNSIKKEFEQFIHFVSHDLKSPVTAILGFTAIINDENTKGLSEDLRHYINRISVNAKMIDKMINDILYISRLKRTDEEIINSSELITESIIPLQPLINNKSINISIDNSLPEIFANRNHISKLFQLIIKNSIKFTDPEGSIRIGYKNDEFFIHDTGVGIKENNIEKVFRIFYTTCEKKENHIGTGLYIAKKIVELYNGSIRIESKSSEGTTVYFTLPLKQEAVK